MLTRVLNAYRAECAKLAHRRIGYFAALIAVAAVVLSAVLSRVGEAAGRLQGQAVAATNGFIVLADGLRAGVGAGSIALLIFAGVLLAEETELGTAKIVFSKPIRRSEIVLAKGLLLLTLAVALVVIAALASIAVAGALQGFSDVVERDARGEVIYTFHTVAGPCPTCGETACLWRHTARAIPQLVPPLAAALLVAFLMSALADQSGIAVGASFGLLVAATAVSTLLDRAAPWLLTSYFSFPTETLRGIAAGESTAEWGARWGGPKGPQKLGLGLAVSGGTALLAFSLAAVAVARREILGLLVAAGLALGALAGPGAAPALAAGKIDLEVRELEVTGQTLGVTAPDLDQDGRADLVVFHGVGRKGPEPRRFLSIFYGREKGYERKPDQTLEIEPDACARFIAEVDPRAPGLEIGFIGPRGAFAYPARNRIYQPHNRKRLFDEPGFFDIAAGTQLPDWDALVKDLSGDGRADIVFPRKGSAAVWAQGPAGAFSRVREVPLEYRQYFGTRVETLLLARFLNYWGTLAKPALADIDGDRRLDLVCYARNGLLVYLQSPDPRSPDEIFPREPDHHFPLRIVSEQTHERDDSYNAVNAAFADVDQDGRTDLILYRNLGKIGLFESMRTQVLLHRSRGPDGWWKEEPDQVLNLKGVSINPELVDADKDGQKDLVLSSLRTDLVSNAKSALFKSVTVTYYVFRWRRDEGRFGPAPDYASDLSIDIERLEGGGTIPVAVFKGDFDGDGIPDLLSLASNDEVRILPGALEEGFFGGETLDYDDDAAATVSIPTSNHHRIADLNRDGKSDIVFWYFERSEKDSGTVRVAVSK